MLSSIGAHMADEWRNQRIFVSGGSGVIGTALVDSLIEAGAKVFVGDLKPEPEKWKGRIRYRQGDLITLTKEEIDDFAPEVFFHLAATFERSEETYDFLEENFHHNIALSHHLLALLKDAPALKQIVFASSYLIYDPDLYLFDTPQKTAQPLSEDSRLHPRNLCGMAKWLHEEELRFVQKYRPALKISIARIFRSYGKNSRDVISRWIRAMLKHEEIAVYRPEGRFDFVFAEDVAAGLKLLAESSHNGCVNLGSGQARSISDVIQILQQHFPHCRIRKADSNIAYEASQADMRQLRGKVRFRPLEETLPLIIQWERENVK